MRPQLDPCHCHLFIQKTWNAPATYENSHATIDLSSIIYLNLFMSLVNCHFWKRNNEGPLLHEKHQLATHVHPTAHTSPYRALNVGVHLGIELEVGDHVRETNDGDISTTCGGGDNADKASARPKFEDTERTMILTIG